MYLHHTQRASCASSTRQCSACDWVRTLLVCIACFGVCTCVRACMLWLIHISSAIGKFLGIILCLTCVFAARYRHWQRSARDRASSSDVAFLCPCVCVYECVTERPLVYQKRQACACAAAYLRVSCALSTLAVLSARLHSSSCVCSDVAFSCALRASASCSSACACACCSCVRV